MKILLITFLLALPVAAQTDTQRLAKVLDVLDKTDLYYTQRPAPVTSTSDTLSLPDKYYQDVVRYCLQQAYEMDEDMANSQAKAQQFDASLNEKSEEERTAQNMTYEKITVYDDYSW